jgi:energy-coupling factor transporter ATP-binding protein EcfA2
MAGSRFVRADLHIHSHPEPNETGEMLSLDQIVIAAKSAGVSVIAVTDHNNTDRAVEISKLADPELLVLPGIEISTADGHVVALFSPSAVDALVELSRPQNLGLRDLPTGGRQSTRSVADLIDEIADRSGLAILSHVDTADGIFSRANPASLSAILSRPGLAGIEITRPESADRFSDLDSDAITRQCWQERKAALGRKATVARLMSSDAHSLTAIGQDANGRTLTRIRLDELSFHAVRLAVRGNPTARCRLEADLDANYPRVVRAGFEGGFLHDLEIDLSANLTTFIGSRGSGKTTALRAMRSCLEGFVPEEDNNDNMPDSTWVEFVDGLGTTRRARRSRHGETVDDSDGVSPIRLQTIDLEQNFGMEFLVEDPSNPVTTTDFLAQFIDTREVNSAEVGVVSNLDENAALILATSTAATELTKLRLEQSELNKTLKAAVDAKLVEVATYARVLAAESPLLKQLTQDIAAIVGVELPEAPDLGDLAAEHEVDLTERPAADHAERLVAELTGLEEYIAKLEEETQSDLLKATEPIRALLDAWVAQHKKWDDEIGRRRDILKAAGLTFQVQQLDRIRSRLRVLETEISRLTEADRNHKAALAERKTLIAELHATREKRYQIRRAISDNLVKEVNRSGGVSVSVNWRRAGNVTAYGARLGRLLNLRSPRSERLATAVQPQDLAIIAWARDEARLSSFRDQSGEPFVPDAKSAMEALFVYKVIFELETLLVEDLPEIAVRFEDDPPGPGRPIGDLSLGQARSILLGFLLAAPTNAPLILDQPEDQLDGPFLAETVVGYLHAAKERRQVIVATHNPNVVVLGDAELVLPMKGQLGRGSVENGGSIDAKRTRDEVVRLLEGGIAAFEERAQRYGLRVERLPE